MESNGGENAAKHFFKNPVIQYSNVPAPWREDNQEAKEEERQQSTSTEVWKTLSCFSRWEQEIITQPLAELQANEERQGNLLQKYEEQFERLSEDQKLSRLCSEAGLRLVEVGQFFCALPSPKGKEHQSLCRDFSMPRDQKGTKAKGGVQSNVRFGPVSDIKVCNHTGTCSVEVQVQSLFKDQTEPWIRIVNGIDKFVGEAMPIQEEEKASGKPLQKQDQY